MENLITVEPKTFESMAIVLEKHPLSGSILIFIGIVLIVLLPRIRTLIEEYVHGGQSKVQTVLSQQELLNKEKNELQIVNKELQLENMGLELQVVHSKQSLERMQELLQEKEMQLYKVQMQLDRIEETNRSVVKRLDRLLGQLGFMRSQIMSAKDLSESAVTKSLLDTALIHLEELYRNID